MMQVTAPAAPVTAPAQANAGKQAEATRAGFARLLQQSRSAQTAAPEANAPGADAGASAAEAQGADSPPTPHTGFKARPKLAEKAPPPRPAEHGPKAGEGQDATQAASSDDPAGAARARRSEAPATDPTLAPWLVAAQPAPSAFEIAAARRQAASEADDTAPGSSARAEGVAGAKADDPSALHDKGAADTKARLETTAASQEALAAWTRSARADSAAAQRVVQPAAEDIGRLKTGSPETLTNAAALGAAAFNPLLGAARDSTPPLTVKLPTPLASPEFAQALGVQMSVLAANGVERAELQLNPAEMGPVSVQIMIEGTNARVDFGADLAATRQIIEAGMPELAGALRDAGFTLAGGGVSQHAGGRSDSSKTPGDTDRGGGRDADIQAVQPAPWRRSVAAGGVDLYA